MVASAIPFSPRFGTLSGMSNLMKGILCSVAAFALVVALPAQDTAKKPAPAKKSKILQPQMTAETGSYAAPAGKMGDAAAEPWSSTTIGAAVDGKPNPGAVATTKVGEIVDFSCYLQVGKHGEKHRGCAQKCFQNGQPIGLLTQ